MAKKPKGIWDIVDTVNDVFGKGKRPSDEFYGGSLGDFKDAVRTAAQFSAQAANPVLESYARNIALPQAGGKPANVKGFVTEQALGAAAIGGSLAASKLAQQTGVAARLSNIVRGKEIIVHGSPVRGLTEVTPRVARFTDEPAVYGMSTNLPAKSRDITGITSVTSGYAHGANWTGAYGPKPPGGGSIYAVEVPKSAVVRPYEKILNEVPILKKTGGPKTAMVYSTKPGKVVGEVKTEWRGADEIISDVDKMLRKAGAPSQNPIITQLMKKMAKKPAPKKGRF